MTTKAFGELVVELVGRNNQEFQVDLRIALAAAQVIISGIIDGKLTAGASLPSSYYKRYQMPVKYDSVLKRNYVEFEPPFLQVGNNNAGLVYVGAIEDEYDIRSNYIILGPSQISDMAGLEVQQLGGRVGVRPEGNNRGYLYNESVVAGDEVSVLMIPQVTKLKMSDEMYGLELAPDGSTEPAYVLSRTVDLIMNKRQFPEDKSTDGQSN